MGQYSTPITGRLLAIVFRNVSEDPEVNIRKLFNDFRSVNDVLYWNLNLSEAVQACRLVGHLQPHTLLIEGFSTDLNDIIEAWCKRLLKFPPGFVIDNVGELRGLQLITVPQVVSIPLDDALCYIIYDLNCTERPSTFEVVCSTLSRWYGGLQMPPLGLVHSALQRLMRSGLIYHTGYGYSILTSEKAHVVRWLTQLPSDLHESPPDSILTGGGGGTSNHTMATSITGSSSIGGGVAICQQQQLQFQQTRSFSAVSPACFYRPSVSVSDACTAASGIVACPTGGAMSPVSDLTGAANLHHHRPDITEGVEEIVKTRSSKSSFLSRLFSRMKPRKMTGSPSGCLPLYSRDNPPPALSYPPPTTSAAAGLHPTSYSPPPVLQPHAAARMWTSAWSPVCQGSRDSPISSTDHHQHHPQFNWTTSELVTTYSEGLLSDPSHLVTTDYRRGGRPGAGSRRPLIATAAHLRHSFALGDSLPMGGGGGSSEGGGMGPAVGNHGDPVWGRPVKASPAQASEAGIAIAAATSEGGPLLSPPSTHDSGFNSSRTLLQDLEPSEPGGSGGTGASSFNTTCLSKAEMLKRRMGPEG